MLLYFIAYIATIVFGQTTESEQCFLPCPYQFRCCVGCDGNPTCLNVSSPDLCPNINYANCPPSNCGWKTCSSTQVCCNGDASNPSCVLRGQASCVKPIPRCTRNCHCGTREICCPDPTCLNAHCLGDGLMCPALCWNARNVTATYPQGNGNLNFKGKFKGKPWKRNAYPSTFKCGWLTCNPDETCCNPEASNPSCISHGQCELPIARCGNNHPCVNGEFCCPGGSCLNSRCINATDVCAEVCAGDN